MNEFIYIYQRTYITSMTPTATSATKPSFTKKKKKKVSYILNLYMNITTATM